MSTTDNATINDTTTIIDNSITNDSKTFIFNNKTMIDNKTIALNAVNVTIQHSIEVGFMTKKNAND